MKSGEEFAKKTHNFQYLDYDEVILKSTFVGLRIRTFLEP